MKRVLIVAHGLNFGGASDSLVILALAYRKLFYEVTIVTPRINNLGYLELLEENGIKLFFEPLTWIYNCNQKVTKEQKQERVFASRFNFKYLISKYDFSIVHFNTNCFPHLVLLFYEIKSKYDFTFLIILHHREVLSGNSQENKNFIRASYLADLNFIISKKEGNLLRSDNTIILNNVLLPIFNREIKVKNKISSRSKKIVMMGGQLSGKKGHLEFLKLASFAKSKCPDLVFHCYGVGSPFNRFFSFTSLRAISLYIMKFFFRVNNICFFPYSKSFISNMQYAHIFIRLSRNLDPWGRDVLEAISNALPVIGIGESSPYIKNGFNGYLVSSINNLEILKSIERILKSEDVYEKFAKNSIELSTKFDLNNYVKFLNSSLKKLLNNKY